METIERRRRRAPAGGTLTAFELPAGPACASTPAATPATAPSPRYDSLLAKVIVRAGAGDLADGRRHGRPGAGRVRIEGVATNIALPARAAARDPRRARVRHGARRPRFVERRTLRRAAPAARRPPPLLDDRAGDDARRRRRPRRAAAAPAPGHGRRPRADAGHRRQRRGRPTATPSRRPAVARPRGDEDGARRRAPARRHVRAVAVARRRHRAPRAQPLLLRRARRGRGRRGRRGRRAATSTPIRADLAEVLRAPRASTLDAARPDAVAKRRAAGQRTARENVGRPRATRAASSSTGRSPSPPSARRRTLEELIERTPADGMVAGIGRVNGELFGRERALRGRRLRLHGARRHAGHAQPPQERPAVRARRAAAAAGRAVRRGRRRAARRHRRAGGRPGSTPRPSRCSAGCGPACRWSASRPAAASPATPRCSAAATSSSPPRTPTSAWAARR